MSFDYTAYLYNDEGATFKDFALRCARGVSPLAALGDEDEDLPELLTVSPGAYRELPQAKRELAYAESLTVEEAAGIAEQTYEDRVSELNAYINYAEDAIERYESMLIEVEAWVPPTEEHQELKDSMREQLTSAIKSKSNDMYRWAYDLDYLTMQSGEEYKNELVRVHRERVEFHERELASIWERNQRRNEWLRKLRASL